MTKEELKNEVEIQNILKTSTLANNLKHNIKCIEQTTVDEKTKEKLLNEIKKEFASKSSYLRKQLGIVLNEIENAKNLDNIVIDDLFKKAQTQIEEEEKQQKIVGERATKEKEIKEKIKEKQKTNEVLTKLKNKINTSELENDSLKNIYDTIENFKDEDIKKELYDVVNSMVSKVEKIKTNNNSSKIKFDSLNSNNLIAKGANKLFSSKTINTINKMKKSYDSFINNKTKNIDKKTTIKEKKQDNNIQNTTQNNNKKTNSESNQNITQKNSKNTNKKINQDNIIIRNNEIKVKLNPSHKIKRPTKKELEKKEEERIKYIENKTNMPYNKFLQLDVLTQMKIENQLNSIKKIEKIEEKANMPYDEFLKLNKKKQEEILKQLNIPKTSHNFHQKYNEKKYVLLDNNAYIKGANKLPITNSFSGIIHSIKEMYNQFIDNNKNQNIQSHGGKSK